MCAYRASPEPGRPASKSSPWRRRHAPGTPRRRAPCSTRRDRDRRRVPQFASAFPRRAARRWIAPPRLHPPRRGRNSPRSGANAFSSPAPDPSSAQIRTVALPGKSPLVTFRIVFTTGSAADPADKPGLAYLTAQTITDGGTKDLTYKQVGDALFPMASSVNAQVDKEMSVFGGATHVDNLAEYRSEEHTSELQSLR